MQHAWYTKIHYRLIARRRLGRARAPRSGCGTAPSPHLTTPLPPVPPAPQRPSAHAAHPTPARRGSSTASPSWPTMALLLLGSAPGPHAADSQALAASTSRSWSQQSVSIIAAPPVLIVPPRAVLGKADPAQCTYTPVCIGLFTALQSLWPGFACWRILTFDGPSWPCCPLTSDCLFVLSTAASRDRILPDACLGADSTISSFHRLKRQLAILV